MFFIFVYKTNRHFGKGVKRYDEKRKVLPPQVSLIVILLTESCVSFSHIAHRQQLTATHETVGAK